MRLIQEKVGQVSGLLKEFGIDCWITFVRESQINGARFLSTPQTELILIGQ